MKRIELKQIRISNFKGIKELSIDFGQVTNVRADNAKGKTTIFDAFCWALFGKDSRGNSKFNIRPIASDGRVVDFIDISVVVSLSIDGLETTIKKVQKQKWVKKRRSEEQSFEGNINEYEWNGFPKSEADFNASITSIITDTIFMMVTNPAYFPSMKWKEQREALTQLVREINDTDVIARNQKFLPLADMFQENTADAWKDKYAKVLKEYKKQMDSMPSRIDEASRLIRDVDYVKEELELSELQKQLDGIDVQLDDISKGSDEVYQLSQELLEQNGKLQKLEYHEKQKHEDGLLKLNQLKSEWDSKFNQLFLKDGDLKRNILLYQEDLKQKTKELEEARESFKQIEQELLIEKDLHCPTCGQAFLKDKEEDIKKGFQKNKKNRLSTVREKGLQLNQRIQDIQAELEAMEAELKKVVEEKVSVVGEKNRILQEINDYPSLDLVSIPEWVDLGAKVKDIEYQLSLLTKEDGIKNSLKEKKSLVLVRIDEVKKVLNQKEIIEDAKTRVKELIQEQKELAQKIADTEKMLYLIEEFTKEKMDALSEAVNNKFKFVNWKLFEMQINGGMKEVCELTMNGVPYSDLNSAGKVQAGLDIINTMTDIYDVTAPIFIDNREGVNHIPDMDAQVINLIVSQDKELKVEVE